MENSEKLSLEQMRSFLEASQEVEFQARSRQELYAWVEQILNQPGYCQLERPAKRSPGHAKDPGARVSRLLPPGIRAGVGDFSGQIYRLRKSRVYRGTFLAYQSTRPAQVAIGERRKPDPQGFESHQRGRRSDAMAGVGAKPSPRRMPQRSISFTGSSSIRI